MDIQKEREAFQKFCEENFDFENHEQTYFDDQTQCYENDVGEDTASINIAWMAWQQAQKVAVPEGFVLVPKEPTEKQKRTAMFVIASDGNAIDAYKAMIEAQEKTND